MAIIKTNNTNNIVLHGILGQTSFSGIPASRSLLCTIDTQNSQTSLRLNYVSASYEQLDATAGSFRCGNIYIGSLRSDKNSVDGTLNVPLSTIARTEQVVSQFTQIFLHLQVQFGQNNVFELSKMIIRNNPKVDILLSLCEDGGRPTSNIAAHLGQLTVNYSVL